MEKFNLILKKLFSEKKFLEVIKLIEDNTSEKDRSAYLFNLLGATLLLSSPERKNILKAIDNFKKAYIKEKRTKLGLEALINFINVTINLFDKDYKENPKMFPDQLFDQIEEYYLEAKNNFKEIDLLKRTMIRKYLRDGSIADLIKLFKEMISKNEKNIDAICSYIYFNCFRDTWDQKTFLKNSILLDKHLPLFPPNKLVPIKNYNTKIKNLAFVSSDIKSNHPITNFLKSIFSKKLKEKFKVYLYYNAKIEDKTLKEVKNFFDISRNINGLNDIESINLIRKDNIDIIFDLMGITSNQKLVLFKNRVAPIQISWCGYFNTTGIHNMDYLISDKNLIFENEKKLYSEKIIQMPSIWVCHNGFSFKREKIKSCVNSNNYITFGSFNNFNKISEKVIKVWSKILKKVPNSKLILNSSTLINNSYLKKKFDENNVLSSVIFFSKIEDFKSHLESYKKIDIGLDTFPYNGVTTSFEAIWMNVPIITIKGYNFISRCGESINKNLGMEELIAKDENDYIDIAVNLAKNVERLNFLREKIFINTANSPLFDKEKFSKEFSEIVYNLN